MGNSTAIAMVFALALSACAMAWGQQVRYYESFEDGVPDYFTATRPDSLSISPWHYKHGGQSLRWDWQAEDEVVIHHGIGDVTRRGGFGTRASFSVWLYMREPAPSALEFQFREGDKVTGSFRFPLNFTGWRQGRPFYHDFPEGQPTSEVDNIRIAAPTDTEQGTVFIDFIKYNTLTYGGNSVIPEREAQWEPPVPDEERFPRPERVTEEQLEGISKLMGPDEGPGIEQAEVDELCERVAALGIVRDEHGVRGPGIDAHYQFHPSSAEAAALGAPVTYWSDEHGPEWEGMQTPRSMTGLANQVARAYQASNDAQQRQRLAEAFLLLADHLHDQALRAGSGFRWYWWVGGAWADSLFLMREVLAEHGRLRPHLDCLLYAYRADAMFAEGDAPSHMDFYHLTVPRLLRQCLMQVEPAEQVQWLNAFKDMMERSMLQPTASLKIDGSAYHHAGHYLGYARNAFGTLPPLLVELGDTPWRLSAEAHERLRRAMLAQRLYCNHLDLPLSQSGRRPFESYQHISPGGLGVFARLGTPDGQQEFDAEVAAAYLRLVPEAADEEPYRSLGIEPEPHPNGTFVMPYAGLLSHRRDDWLASVHGQSRYVWGSERQDDHNRFGLFQGVGHLEILAGGSPVTAEASGSRHFGWDWSRFEGTTVPQLPLDRLDDGWGRLSGLTYSPETFMGGLSHRGDHGVFAMILNQSISPDTTLTGRKSWFFIDDQIICLGSDIYCDEPQHPTQTTLCQRALLGDEEDELPPTLLNGTEMTAFPDEQVLDDTEPHWFIDVQQTGYYLPAGQHVTVARRNQTSRDYLDQHDTEGDFLTAWINHGIAPSDAAYEYMLVVRATPETMQMLTAEPPYQVIQRDSEAHIIWHPGSSLWGCAFFVEHQVSPHTAGDETLPVKAVDRPCLIMAEMVGDGQLHLSVADPDLNMDPPRGQGVISRSQALRVTLRGAWRLLEATATVNAWHLPDTDENVRILSADAQETVVEIICQHGASYDLSLARE